MPSIYLSPSTQEFNLFYDESGSEEYYMNLIADAMEPYLVSSGIEFNRNTPEMTAASSIRESNAGTYDVHIALHSNAAPPNLSGQIRGTDVYYSPSSERGARLAEIVSNNLKFIYPDPALVKPVPTTSIGEVTRTKAPAVLIEYAYHDNPQDAEWIKANINALARSTVLSLTEYFGIPFIDPTPVRTATVETTGSNLNVRAQPAYDAAILAKAPDGSRLTVLGEWNNWYLVQYNGVEGYVRAEYITITY